MFDLVEKYEVRPERVRRIRVVMSETANKMHGIFPRYQGKFDALLSTHYAAAAVLHDRALTLAQFEPARYNDPKLKSFAADNVEVVGDPQLKEVQAVIEAELTDGRVVKFRCDTPRGAPENRLTRAQIEAKFRTYAKPTMSGARIDEIIGMVSKLEDLGSVRKLMDALRAEKSAARKSVAA